MKPLPVEVAMIKAAAEYEAKHGSLTDMERLIFQRGFLDGHHHGLDTGSAIFDDALAQVGVKP